MTKKCISTAGEREVLAPSPGIRQTQRLALAAAVPVPRWQPPARVPPVWHHPRGHPGDAPLKLAGWEKTKRHLISARRPIAYARSQLLLLL